MRPVVKAIPNIVGTLVSNLPRRNASRAQHIADMQQASKVVQRHSLFWTDPRGNIKVQQPLDQKDLSPAQWKHAMDDLLREQGCDMTVELSKK